MPLFTAPVAGYMPVSEVRPSEQTFLTADIEEAVLVADSTRKGHMLRNTGTTTIVLTYGIVSGTESAELYRITLAPGDGYLHDLPEIIPYSGLSKTDGGTLQILELF